MACRATKIEPKKAVTSDPDFRDNANEGAIAARAYELWHARGCPIGTPETDWLCAEEELRKRREVKAA